MRRPRAWYGSAVLLLAMLFDVHDGYAQAISINVGNRGAHFATGLQPNEIAGAFPVGNWNDYTRNSFAQEVPTIPAGTLKDSSGALVPNFAFSIVGSLGVVDTYNYADDGDPAHLGNLKLMGSFIKGPFEPTIGLDIVLTAVPYAEYDLYIYNDGFGTGMTLWDLVETGETYYSVDASGVNFLVANQVLDGYVSTDFSEAQAELANPSSAHNYMKISGLTAPDLTLKALRPGGGEEAITGIQIVNAADIEGDYDGNGRVDGGDFLLWQSTLGSTTDLAADGDESERIDAGDLTVWRMHYGEGSSVGVAVTAPEPAAAAMAALAVAMLTLRSRRRARVGQR